jgi:hypothetical protein
MSAVIFDKMLQLIVQGLGLLSRDVLSRDHDMLV